MTKALYSEDAYLKSCSARVTAISDDGVVLDQTVFYPMGGGQPGDTGELVTSQGPLKVFDTRKGGDGSIVHMLDGMPRGLAVGDEVEAEIDWERRYRHMRMHTGLHLLGAVLRYGVTGGAIGAERSRLDFDMEETVDRDMTTLALNELVDRNAPVSTRWITDEELEAQPDLVRTLSVQPPKGAGRVRLLEIEGIDLQPCGGTHVRQTGEVGSLRLGKVEKKGRRNRRVQILFAD